METKGLMHESLHKNDQSIMEGGIHISNDTEQSKLKESIEGIPNWVVEDVKHLNETNKKEQEIQKEDDNSSQLSANEVRHRKLQEQHQGQRQNKKSIEADAELSALLSDASYCARLVTGNKSKALNDLDALKFDLKHAGRGKHKNYDDFEKAFNNFYDSITLHTLTPGKELVDKDYLKNLYDLNQTVIDTANDYLKDKKMNLPRHMAVKSILDKAHQQSAALWGVLRKGA